MPQPENKFKEPLQSDLQKIAHFALHELPLASTGIIAQIALVATISPDTTPQVIGTGLGMIAIAFITSATRQYFKNRQ